MAKKTDAKKSDVIVIGGGASGLMAAITAAENGASVTVLDHHPTPGKKLLSTGNGKCNFTNQKQERECYRSDDPAFVMRALKQFGSEDAIAFFQELGVYAKSRNGYYYPRSGQASTHTGSRPSAIRLAQPSHLTLCPTDRSTFGARYGQDSAQ